ncbi:MAG TPA: PAS domain-containing sensor histidine kinase, partial [Anaerolineae bacterium]
TPRQLPRFKGEVMAKRTRVQPVPDETNELKNRLKETEETLEAIRQYLVDAFVVTRSDGTHVVTIKDADYPYRLMVEAMNEGAVTLIPDGTIFYCNPHFCKMIQMECEQVIGVRFQDLVLPAEQEALELILNEVGQAGRDGIRGEFCLQAAQGECVPVQLSAYELLTEGVRGISIIATDLTERVKAEKKIRSLASALTKAEQVERHRISQILHDDLQQRLFAIKAQLSMLTYGGENGISPKMQSALQQIQSELSETVAITRSLSVEMSPVVLHGEGLADAILWLASQMKEQFGLQVELIAKDDFKYLEDHMRVLLFRAVRELLFNIVKHAHVTQATVSLSQVEDQLRITVSDAGTGFNVAAVMSDPNTAHGLLVIRDRLSLMGGRMEMTSELGKGTHVVIEIPRKGISD